MTTTAEPGSAARRVKVPVTEAQARALADVRDPHTTLGRLAQRLSGKRPGSESAAAALLFDLGLKMVQEQALDDGYAALAAQQATAEGQAETATLRARRDRAAASWDAE